MSGSEGSGREPAGDEADREEWADDSLALGDAERSEQTTGAATDSRDALETLPERYAAGELSDEQFELEG